MIGLHLIRIEFSGIKFLDELNKNINTNNFNAALSMSIIILIIFGAAPLLNWFILDANFVGESKEACTGGGACWVYIKVWFNRFIYGMYPNAEQWRVQRGLMYAWAGGDAISNDVRPAVAEEGRQQLKRLPPGSGHIEFITGDARNLVRITLALSTLLC